MHLYAPCSVVYSSQDLEITHQPDNKCEAKDGVYVYMESYLIIKKDENLAIYNSFNESWGVMLNEIIRKEKDKYCVISVLWAIQKSKTETFTCWQQKTS